MTAKNVPHAVIPAKAEIQEKLDAGSEPALDLIQGPA
jgi:hypothetical protein